MTDRGTRSRAKPVDRSGSGQVAKMKALANPLRIRILEQMAQRAMTVTQVAAALGEPRTKLYRHVGLLQGQGFVSVVSKRKVAGIFEKTYQAEAGPLILDEPALAGEKTEFETTLEVGLAAGFDQTRREIREAIEVGRIDVTDEEGPSTLVAARGYMHVTERQAEEFIQRLQRQLRELGGSVTGIGEKTERYGFTIVFHAAPDAEEAKE